MELFDSDYSDEEEAYIEGIMLKKVRKS